MSKRYSIDDPFLEEGPEEDIVLGSLDPTDRDRELLRADEAVLNDIQKKSSYGSKAGSAFSGKSIMKKYKSLVKEAKSHKKRVGFAPLSSTDESADFRAGNGSKYDRNSSLPSHYNKHSNHPVEYGDSDSDDDIQIDISEGLSRGELRRKARRFHGAVILLVVCIFLWLAYKQILPSLYDNSDSKYDHYYPQIPSKLLSNGTHKFKPTTLLISLGGFHPHYVNEKITPNLHKLMIRGGSAPYMIPSFPSSSFPNHWSMVTGLYPANHGIVGNTFWDAKTQKRFLNTDPAESLAREWWGGQPIWETAAQQGVSSAIHMWPGSEVEWDKGSIFEVDAFNSSELLGNKAKRVFSWIDLEDDKRPEMILAYVPTIGTVVRKVGIADDKLTSALREVDSLVGSFVQGISDRNLTDILNLIVVSDNGMAPTSNDRLIYLDDIVEAEKFDYTDGWPLVALRPKPSTNLKALYRNLVEAQSQFGQGKWDVYLCENLPKEWHFGGHYFNKWQDRIAPLWLVPRAGYTFTTKKYMEKLGGDYKPRGLGGYNNTEVLMRALFVAQGPYFTNDRVMPFENVGIYKILCGSLGIKPSKSDGPSFSEIFRILPANWTDSVEYPNVTFKSEILNMNSTYDTLFRHRQAVESLDDQWKSIEAAKNDQNKTEANVSGSDSGSAKSPQSDKASKGDKDSEEESKSWWKQWVDYFADKAHSVGQWISSKIGGSKGNDDKDKDGDN